MKKLCSFLIAFSILSSAMSIPVFAEKSEKSNQSDTMTLDNNRMINNGTDMNTNNYRTNAATDDNDMDWGWLGLLGLAGLIGLKSRDRERT
ncbi:WGxxGxxG family protein [Bacillus sp. FJAT-28004]|uniref:WGxxGxxG family protein n=1 Tax=Bacillus sp. FJAT-28004 TaxID=1679165 RepID=UPI0006B68A22|nr:WGxxGxxG family protein [Bacillus sp. FJAT-28004]